MGIEEIKFWPEVTIEEIAEKDEDIKELIKQSYHEYLAKYKKETGEKLQMSKKEFMNKFEKEIYLLAYTYSRSFIAGMLSEMDKNNATNAMRRAAEETEKQSKKILTSASQSDENKIIVPGSE